jgi:hypothetical protein
MSLEIILAAIHPKSKPGSLCGTKGHKAAYFWDNDKNKEKCPSNYRKKTPASPSSSQNNQIKKIKCEYCHKAGHTIDCCYRKKNKDWKQIKSIIWFALP